MIQNMCMMTFAEKMQQLSPGARNFFLYKLEICSQKRKEQAPEAGQIVMEVVHNLYHFFNAPKFTYLAYDENRKTNNVQELIPLVKLVNAYTHFSAEEKAKFESIALSNPVHSKKSLAILQKKAQDRQH